MKHWAAQYVGQPWAPDKDCLYWFRFWSREHFCREVQDKDADHRFLLQSASRLMSGNIKEQFGPWEETCEPQEGDAVFLSQRTRPHHIGIVVFLRGKLYVLHALEGAGVLLSDCHDLVLNGWKIRSYWTYAG